MLQIASMPFPGSPPLRIAVIDAPLDNDLVRRLIDLEVDGVELLRESAPHGNSHAQGLEWLTEASTVQHVTIDWATAPSIPLAVLRNLRSLTITSSKARSPIECGDLTHVRVLEAPSRILSGALANAPALEWLTLRTFPPEGLQALDGCTTLRSARIRGRQSLARFGWHISPSSLEELTLESVSIEGLAGLESLPELRILSIEVKHPNGVTREPLDLSPLITCRKLRVVLIGGIQTTGKEAIESLPALQTFFNS